MPVVKPNNPKKMPMLANSTAQSSKRLFEVLKYFIEKKTDVPNMATMLNHMGTWKYRFLMVSYRISRSGIAPKSPIITTYISMSAVADFQIIPFKKAQYLFCPRN
jgi:hypothetical protein